MLNLDEFERVDMRVGTVLEVKPNKRAKKKAYQIKIDVGKEIGIKFSSAQLTDQYQAEELVGKQVIVVVNFEPIRIGDVKSEVRILGVDTNDGCILIYPDKKVENGSKIF